MTAIPVTEEELKEWKGEHWSLVGPSWTGFKDIRYLIIFGASYTQTNPFPASQFVPTEEEPLGIPFPGITSTEGPANWVGHLVYQRRPPILVYNYAISGHTVHGVANQVTHHFMDREAPVVPWSAKDTLFITQIGINDLFFSQDYDTILRNMFESQWKLYEKGARNFLFIDVPCVDRSPSWNVTTGPEQRLRYPAYNLRLQNKIRQFASSISEAGRDPITVLYFSFYKVFTSILDAPEDHGFPCEDIRKKGGSIWYDNLHPTSKVHAILAAELDKFLSGVEPITE
ncbi:hypothetical protein CPB86DRAFT_780720 [Serendipita vermifera]|nr:hypothetical protein CPB86DRAFT_780720 [Serendipita vermifera]